MNKVCREVRTCVPGAPICEHWRVFCPEESQEHGTRNCIKPERSCARYSATDKEAPKCETKMVCDEQPVKVVVPPPKPRRSLEERRPIHPWTRVARRVQRDWSSMWHDHLKKKLALIGLQGHCDAARASCKADSCPENFMEAPTCRAQRAFQDKCAHTMWSCKGKMACLVASRNTTECQQFRSAHRLCRDCQHCRAVADEQCNKFEFAKKRAACTLVSFYCDSQRSYCSVADQCTAELAQLRNATLAQLAAGQARHQALCLDQLKQCGADAECKKYVRWTQACTSFRRARAAHECEVQHDVCHSTEDPKEAAKGCLFVKKQCPGDVARCHIEGACRGAACYVSRAPPCLIVAKQRERTVCATLRFECEIHSNKAACHKFRRAACHSRKVRLAMRAALISPEPANCQRSRWLCRIAKSRAACRHWASNPCYRQHVSGTRRRLQKAVTDANRIATQAGQECTAIKSKCVFTNGVVDRACMDKATEAPSCQRMEQHMRKHTCNKYALACFVNKAKADCDKRDACRTERHVPSYRPAFPANVSAPKEMPAHNLTRPTKALDLLKQKIINVRSALRDWREKCRAAFEPCKKAEWCVALAIRCAVAPH